ncbi:MAG: tail fiber domain-containing protein [Bacteroidales bacterium]|nr:tail fiber domain-containing protein [Bacteroidales bacterium]
MKKILFVLLFAFATLAQAQQGPTGIGSQTQSQYWSRTGNIGPGSNPTGANIFGTAWNSPIYTITNGVVRTRLNGTLLAGINGVLNHNVTGFFGIGVNNYFANETPMSMLHIEGPNNTNPIQSGLGWRTWMRTGVFMKENSDAMYVGLQQQAGTNRSDAIIGWSDDFEDIWGGADRLKIVLTAPAAGNGSNSSATDGSSLLGYEFMQFVTSNYQTNANNFPAGFVGIGPVFTTVRPQSRLHINSEGNLETWLQISNQTGTGQTQTDGFRMGVTSNGTANLRQQENRPIIFYTDWNTVSGGVTDGERLRVTAVGQPDVPNPSNVFPTNTTRVSISHNGANPIHQPRSLLHLGYNTGSFSNQGADGWRTWMDIGMFVTDGTDNVYLGLKKTAITDRTDAVLSWGDNQPLQSPDGPDNLLFVFTATNSALVPSTGQSATVDGVEGMRMTPTQFGVNVGIGGDPVTNTYFYNSVNPTQTLEVNSTATNVGPLNSGLRFTDLRSSATPLANNPNAGFLTVSSEGDVIYMAQNTQSGGNVGAENGCSTNGNNNVVLGNNTGLLTAQLSDNREIPMSKFDILFTETGKIGIGNVFTGGATMPIAKLDVHAGIHNRLALNVESNIDANFSDYIMSEFNNNSTNGLTSTSIDVLNNGNAIKRKIGINILVNNTTATAYNDNVGIISQASNGGYNTGGGFLASGDQANTNLGISASGQKSHQYNIGGSFRGGDPVQYSGGYNGIQNIGVSAEGWGAEDCYGIYAKATGGSNLNYGIYAEALPALNPFGPNLAGYFNGHVLATGDINSISDSILKENITTIDNALEIITNLKSHKYNFKNTEFPTISLPQGDHFGLIAQEVELILPELVGVAVAPAKLDSSGNISVPEISHKTLNYSGFIPILIQAVKEINTKSDSAVLVLNNRIDSLENIISTFESRFEELSDQIDECCKNGHGHGHGHGHGNNKNMDGDEQTEQPSVTQIELEYSDAIVLEQNVPNPFAEKTTINYNIPEGISFAHIIFSNNYGKIIKTVDITSSGQGSIIVYASNLSSGIYNYSLIVDGKVIETKRMICAK